MRIKVCHWHSFGGLVDSENWNGALPKEDIDIKDGFDALLGYNIITTEFINFKGPKLFISGEPLRYLDDFTRDMLHILPEKHIWAYWKGNMEERAFPYGTLSDFALFKFSEEIKENCNKKRPKKICFINNYKYQGTRECAHDLQSSRDSLVLEFAKQGVEVDVYGRNWEKSLLNKSTLLINNGMTYNKLNILKNYDFIVNFENTRYRGYITEKPYHALYTGTIPIYTCGDKEEILDYLDEDIFIEAGFNTPEEIVEKVCSMSQDEIIEMQLRIANFLKNSKKIRINQTSIISRRIIEKLQFQP